MRLTVSTVSCMMVPPPERVLLGTERSVPRLENVTISLLSGVPLGSNPWKKENSYFCNVIKNKDEAM